jgi:hypothetical protein
MTEKTLQDIRREKKQLEKLALIVNYTPSETHPDGTRAFRRKKVKRGARFHLKSPRNK